MDDFEKALLEEMKKRPYGASLIYHAGASWAKEWLLDEHETLAKFYEADKELVKAHTENQRLREALEKIDKTHELNYVGEIHDIARNALKEPDAN